MDCTHLCDIDEFKNVQRIFTKSLQDLRYMSYPEKLDFLDLEILELRRGKADLILAYEMTEKLL